MERDPIPTQPQARACESIGHRMDAEADDGVDVTLIRWMLSLTPKERMDTLQANTDALIRLRNAVPS